jgi:hypothetical protein
MTASMTRPAKRVKKSDRPIKSKARYKFVPWYEENVNWYTPEEFMQKFYPHWPRLPKRER